MLNNPLECDDFVVTNPNKSVVILSGLGGITIASNTYNYDLKKIVPKDQLTRSIDLNLAFKNHWLYPASKAPKPSNVSYFDDPRRRFGNDEAIRVRIDRKMPGFGDVLFTSVVTRAIKEMYPNAYIVYGVNCDYYNGGLKKLVEHNPFVDKVIDYKAGDEMAFDIKVDLSNSAMQYETSHQPNVKKSRTDCHLDLCRVWTNNRIPVYEVTDQEHELAVNWIERFGIGEYKIIGIELRCNAPNRNYPYFKELSKIITDNRKDTAIILFDHIKNDLEWKGERIYHCLQQDITFVSALMEMCDLFLAPDSGLSHLAGALEIPVFGLYGQIDGQYRIGQYRNADWIQSDEQCSPCWYSPKRKCDNKCLKGIKPEQVWNRIKNKI